MSRNNSGVNYKVLVIGFALVAPLVVLLWSGFGKDPHAVPQMLVGQPAPDFQLTDLDGDTWSLSELRGKPVVINFWSTWCGPCKSEHGLLQQAAKSVPDVQFLGVIYSDEPDACRRYLARAGTTYDHLIDDEGRLAIDYGVGGVPETYFIDADGMIVHKQVGPVNGPILSNLLTKIRGGG